MMIKQIKSIARRDFFGLSAAAALLTSPLRRLGRDGGGGAGTGTGQEDAAGLGGGAGGDDTPAPEEPDESGDAPPDSRIDSPAVVYSIPGAGSSTGCVVMSGVPSSKKWTKVYLAWSLTEDPNHPGRPLGPLSGGLFPAAQVASDTVGTSFQAMLRHAVTGLTPATVYFASLNLTNPTTGLGTWQGDPIRFRTFPSPTATGTEVKWAYGSCQYFYGNDNNPRQSDGVTALQAAWTDMRTWQRTGGDRVGPDQFWDTGDLHYQGGNKQGEYGNPNTPAPLTYARMYWQQIGGNVGDNTTGLPEMRLARALVLEDQVSDDHEFSANNGDSGSVDKDKRLAQITASTGPFAMYPLAGNSGTTPGMYGTYMLTQNVRVIVLDAESTARAPQPLPAQLPAPPIDGDFLGGPQTDWLFNQVLTTPVTLNIFICGKSYPGELGTDHAGNPVVTANDVDKTWAYRAWRDPAVTGFGAKIAALQAQGQGFLWIGGDRHKIGYMPKENNVHGGFACLVGSGWSQHHLTAVPGEQGGFTTLYEGFDAGADGLGQLVMQYLRGTITDNGPKDVSVAVEMRYLKPPDPSPVPVPRWQWQMATLATVTIAFSKP